MNILDYLDWRGDLSFDAAQINEVDALIFAWLSYYRFEDLGAAEKLDGLTLRELAALHEQLRGPFQKVNLTTTIRPSLTAEWLLYCASLTPRFVGVRVRGFQSDADRTEGVQFAAVSFGIEGARLVVAYRGTDATINGWKEDFQLSFLEAVPAQIRAAQYLQDAADGQKTLVCGHSKGGNLAVYAALHASEAQLADIERIYNFDGPGFCFDTLDQERYARIRERVVTIVPEASIIGMLLEHDEDYRVVRSQMASILQHDAMFWKVLGNHFVYADKLSASSVFADKVLSDWIRGMSLQERKTFVEAIFGILESTGAETFSELPERIVQNGFRALTAAATLDPQQKKMAFRLLTDLVKAGNANLYESAALPGAIAETTRSIVEGTGHLAEAVEQKLGAIGARLPSPQSLMDKLRAAKSEEPPREDDP